MKMGNWFKLFAALGAIVLALGLAACGGSDDDGNGGGETTAAENGSGGGESATGARTIGVIPSTTTSEHLSTRIAQLEATVEPLGWEVILVDGEGNPQAMEQGMERLIGQGVDAIFTMALGGEEIARGLAQAEDAGIPVMAVVTDPSPGQEENYDAVFADGTVNMGRIAGEYIVENLSDQPVNGIRLTQNFAGDGFIIGVMEVLEENGMEFDDLRDTDLADIVNSMVDTTEAVVQANPGPMTFVEYNDVGASLHTPTFDRLGRADDITFITRYDNPSTVELMRAGYDIRTTNSMAFRHIFDAVDALIQLWVNDQPLPDSPQINEPEAGVFTVDDIPEGQDSIYPFEPELEAQLEEWQEYVVD